MAGTKNHWVLSSGLNIKRTLKLRGLFDETANFSSDKTEAIIPLK